MIIVAAVALHLAAFSPFLLPSPATLPRHNPPLIFDTSEVGLRARWAVFFGLIAAEVLLAGLVWLLRWEHLRAKRLYSDPDERGSG